MGRIRWYHVPLFLLAIAVLKIQGAWQWIDRRLFHPTLADGFRWYHIPLFLFNAAGALLVALREWAKRKIAEARNDD